MNTTVNSTTEVALHLIQAEGTGTAQGVDIADGKTYNLTETVYVEANMVNNTDKFVSVVSLYILYTFTSFVKGNNTICFFSY